MSWIEGNSLFCFCCEYILALFRGNYCVPLLYLDPLSASSSSVKIPAVKGGTCFVHCLVFNKFQSWLHSSDSSNGPSYASTIYCNCYLEFCLISETTIAPVLVAHLQVKRWSNLAHKWTNKQKITDQELTMAHCLAPPSTKLSSSENPKHRFFRTSRFFHSKLPITSKLRNLWTWCYSCLAPNRY